MASGPPVLETPCGVIQGTSAGLLFKKQPFPRYSSLDLLYTVLSAIKE